MEYLISIKIEEFLTAGEAVG